MKDKSTQESNEKLMECQDYEWKDIGSIDDFNKYFGLPKQEDGEWECIGDSCNFKSYLMDVELLAKELESDNNS